MNAATSPGAALIRAESRFPARAEINDLGLLANHLARSGFFRDAKGGTQAFAKLLFGRDLGLSATAAMTGVHIIEGKPEVSANIQAQMVRTYTGPEGERYDYRVLRLTDTECEIEFRRRWERGSEWETLGTSHFTTADAERAKLATKENWRKYPRNMFFARAMSDGVAFHCPEVTNGIHVYHDFELDVDGAARAASDRSSPAPQAVEVVDGEVEIIGVEPDIAPDVEPEPLPDGVMAELIAVCRAPGVEDAQLRMHLVAVGATDVSADLLTTLRGLTVSQANELLDMLGEPDDREAEAVAP